MEEETLSPHEDIGDLLARARQGDRDADNLIIERVYRELRSLAHFHRRGFESEWTLQTTEVAHEALIKLLGRRDRLAAADHHHLIRIFGKTMRHVLVDRAKARDAGKRGAGQRPLSLTPDVLAAPNHRWRPDELLALDHCLRRLAEVQPRGEEVIQLRLFVGCTWKEAADALGVSETTAKIDFHQARQWLFTTLQGTDLGTTE